MKICLALILCIFTFPAMASHVMCFSGGKPIYSGYADLVYYDKYSIMVHNAHTGKDTFIFGECIVNV